MKRAQIQFGESLAVIIILVVMIVLGIMFYARLQHDENTETSRTHSDLKAIEIAKLASSLPELKCTGRPVQDKTCIDMEKAIRLEKWIGDNPTNLHYVKVFGDATVKLYFVYPTPIPVLNPIEIMKQTQNTQYKTTVQVPVTIHDPSTRKSRFGYLEVSSGG
jgi:hypothetical protein